MTIGAKRTGLLRCGSQRRGGAEQLHFLSCKRFCVVLFASVLLLVAGCDYGQGSESSFPPEPEETARRFAEFEYAHFASGGVTETYTAVIAFEQSVSTFTAYQVVFVSCTCRDALANYFSVCYVEILNTRPTADEAAIRSISFSNNMGLWGDSNPNYYIPEYTQQYMDEHFVQMLVRATKAEFDAWEGYGSQLECIDADAVTGATVSTSNITSMLRSLFEYHADKYYS